MIAQGRLQLRPRRPPAVSRVRLLPARWRLLLAVVVALGALGTGAWMWLRDSSLVAVKRVSVSGQAGPDSGAIGAALRSAARNMSTLDVKLAELRAAVAPYPVVKSIQVTTQFPHGMRIHVTEQVPVADALVGGRRIAVAGDGTLLRDLAAPASLPTITLAVPPGGSRVTDPSARSEVSLLAAAPPRLLAAVSEVNSVSGHGLVAQVKGGPSLYFGSGEQLTAKWIAAAEVLADPGSEGASYIDVTDPQRPAAGAGSDQGGG